MMANEQTIIDILSLFRGVGLSKVPDNDDAHQWVRVLSDVPEALLHMAAEHYLRTPVESKGRMQGVSFCPTAPVLRSIAFALESTHRHEIRKTRRGCARCGELLDDQQTIVEHGRGYRTIVQHCHPTDAEGMVQWDEPPYRIGTRQVLCDCEKGKWIAHQHSTMDASTLPKHIAADWKPTLTIEQALKHFQRRDARLFITGSEYRLHAHDRRAGSPWFTRPSPEEEWGDNDRAADTRATAYAVIRGEIDPRQVISERLAQMGRR